MVEVRRYTASDAPEWDAFVEGSKNGTFLLRRAYMDYHSDRFEDHSLMFHDKKGRLIALLPANIRSGEDGTRTLLSHEGLTYGGLILGKRATMEAVLEMFVKIKEYLQQAGVSSLYYKQIPTCFHRCPSQEDEYALWRMGARLEVCNISTTVDMAGPYSIPMERCRRYGLSRSRKAGYVISEASSPDVFWPIMVDNLKEKYGVSPAHTLAEMRLLMGRFPKEIRCFLAERDGRAEAGAVLYICGATVHVQYAHATHRGKEDRVLDLLNTTLMEKFKAGGFRYYDFGISNEDRGRILNTALIAQKEGFGGRATAYKQWRLTI